MGTPIPRRRKTEAMRVVIMPLVGVVFGFYLGISFPIISLRKVNLPSSKFSSIDLSGIEDKYPGLSTQALLNIRSSFKSRSGASRKFNNTEIWVPTNPRGAERLPPGIIVPESDLYMRRLSGRPAEDIVVEPRYLVTFTVGFEQIDNINAAVRKLSENFTVVLFHYDGRTTEWDKYEWSERVIHVSARKQTKWWYAKRFLHPDIVAAYDYIFIWDEDLGVDNFDPEEYIRLVKKHKLDISQPGLSEDSKMTWQMTRRQRNIEVHKKTKERPRWCTDPLLPPCAAFVEIMAPVFSRKAWRCVWHMLQNDLVHGWGLDFVLRKCVEPAHDKIGVVDKQWIVHRSFPTLGNQGEAGDGKAPWVGVRKRCRYEWDLFIDRFDAAEQAYFEAMGINVGKINSKWVYPNKLKDNTVQH